MEPSTILGIDPGARAGWAVGTIGQPVRVLEYGIVKAQDTPVTSVVSNLLNYNIQSAVIEQQYLDEKSKRNPRTVVRTAQLAGRWEEALLAAGIPLVWVLASKWQGKMLKGLVNTFSGKRNERKKASQWLVKGRWGLTVPVDAADAALIMAYQAELLWFNRHNKRGQK